MNTLYRLIKPILFQIDPEKAHYLTMNSFAALARSGVLKSWFRSLYYGDDTGLQKTVMGLDFTNPIGLAAGFDKDARYIDVLALLGFGFIEIGTLTPRPQTGNPKPRLFRLPVDEALINRMGFNNQGVEKAAIRLEKLDRPAGLIIGGNIGKNKDTPNEEAARDYLVCLQRLHPLVDYFVVNVSSPNTPGLRALQDKEPLRKLLLSLQDENQKHAHPKPILLKIAPDLENSQLDDMIDIVAETKLAGLVATNTTLDRTALTSDSDFLTRIGAGGMSGAPLFQRSGAVLQYLRGGLPHLPIIGVGGIQSPETAIQKLENGADLVQIYSGMIYAGPNLIGNIKKNLSP